MKSLIAVAFIREDDSQWPHADKVGRQELEIVIGDEHISFTVRPQNLTWNLSLLRILTVPLFSQTAKIGSLLDVQESKDPEGLRVFYYIVQDIKCFVFSLINLHFKIKPIG